MPRCKRRRVQTARIFEEMITYEEALRLIEKHVEPLGKCEARLEDMFGAYLAEDVVATMPSPQFDNSAVDGYGVRANDLAAASSETPKELKLVTAIAAGAPSDLQIESGQAVKIFTGARVPTSCQAVVMREYCREENGNVLIECTTQPGENIRRQGEEYRKGETVLHAGIKVTPPVVSLLASLGHVRFPIFEKPRVALVVTGDELVEPGHPLKEGQIYNSNAYGLTAALNALGIKECTSFIARDTREQTSECFKKALEQSDLVISSGGVSVGDHDYVKETLEALGAKTIFWRIAIKPGKPVYFGVLETGGKRKYIFGLPGNPVSVLVTFHQIVKPAIKKMAGGAFSASRSVRLKTGARLKKRPGRVDFVRGTLMREENGDSAAIPTRGQESHMLSGLAKADALLHFASEAEQLEPGDPVDLTLINWAD